MAVPNRWPHNAGTCTTIPGQHALHEAVEVLGLELLGALGLAELARLVLGVGVARELPVRLRCHVVDLRYRLRKRKFVLIGGSYSYLSLNIDGGDRRLNVWGEGNKWQKNWGWGKKFGVGWQHSIVANIHAWNIYAQTRRRTPVTVVQFFHFMIFTGFH